MAGKERKGRVIQSLSVIVMGHLQAEALKKLKNSSTEGEREKVLLSCFKVSHI